MSIKDKIRESKLYAFYHFHAKYFKTRNDVKIELADGVKCKMIREDGTNFFGYYDKPCISKGKAIVHHLDSDSLKYKQKVDICIDDKKISETCAWNWQQGSMATWLDDSHIIHNDFDGNKFISKIVDIHTNEYRIIDFPIYSLSKDKKFALSLNFSRLAKLRKDYGYFNLPYEQLPSNKDDGIWYVDIEKNTSELYLTLEDIIAFKTRDNMVNAVHKVNHIDISPDSKKAIFLHRWFVGKTKYTRLLCMDIASRKLTLLADNDMVSHMCWYGNDKVFGYLRGKNGKDGCFFIDMDGNEEQFENELLIDDGHPTVYNKDYIVIDSYPDYTCKSKLMLLDVKNRKVNVVGRFYSGKRYQADLRCDLHPRFNAEGKMLTIDSVANGRKNIYQIDLSELI